MNNEAKLLSKVLADRNLAPLFDRGVNDSWFVDPDVKRVWIFTRQHFFNYAECPSLDVISGNFPAYKLLEVNDSVDYLIDTVISDRRKAATINMMDETINILEKEKDHEKALLVIQGNLAKLEEDGLSKTSDLDLTDNALERFNEYEFRKNNPGMLGVPTGFPTMDQATNGLQDGQLIVIVAPPKTGKSTLALQVAQNIHMQDKCVMF